MEGCDFCEGRFSETVVKEYENWQVQLFLNQYYLGRCLVKLKTHKVDLVELSNTEREEFFEKVLPELEEALNDLFSPDLYNHCSLGNDCRHLHFHVIPRYSEPPTFNHNIFPDENWNRHYKPYPADFEMPEKDFQELREKIEESIND